MDLSSNPALGGALPASLFTGPNQLRSVRLAGCGLAGSFPALPAEDAGEAGACALVCVRVRVRVCVRACVYVCVCVCVCAPGNRPPYSSSAVIPPPLPAAAWSSPLHLSIMHARLSLPTPPFPSPPP